MTYYNDYITTDDGERKKVRSITASDIASFLAPPSPTPEKYLVFGKAFEEAYTLMTYLGKHGNSMSGFCQNLKRRLHHGGVEDENLISRGYRMASCLLSAGAKGRKPKTQSKKLDSETIVYGQPDLYHSGDYTEFKTGPIDEYARKQSEVFCWVIGRPIRLIGLKEKDDGWVEAEKEVIDKCTIDMNSIYEDVLERKKAS